MQNIHIPGGVWPAMITPLNADQSIDWKGIDALTDWYIEAGVAGLFAVGQSSEMFSMTDDERLSLAEHVVQRAGGRLPVVASGTFGETLEQQAEFVRKMADTGVQAVTILPSMIAVPGEDDSIWRSRVERLLVLTDPVPLALYECPQPYHRMLSPELVSWAAQTGRFYLMKETSRSPEAVKAKIAACESTSLRFFNADTTTLLDSLKAGGSGYCGIAANFYPELVVWLCSHFQDVPHEAAQLQAVLGVLDPIIHSKYPVCAKYFRRQAGFDMLTISRVTQVELDAYDQRAFGYLAEVVKNQQDILQAVTARL